MKKTLVAISALLLTSGFLLMGNGIYGTLIGIRSDIEHFPLSMIGWIMSAYYAGFIIGSVTASRIVQRVGHIRALATLASSVAIVIGLHSIFINPIAWIVLRFLAGICFAGLYVVIESWLNAKSDKSNRGTILSTYMVVCHTAQAIAQWFLPLASPEGYELFVAASIAICASVIPVLLTKASPPQTVDHVHLELRELFKTSPLGMVGCFASGLIMASFWGMGALFAKKIGLGNQDIATFLSITILGGILLQWPVGWISDKMDRRRVILSTCSLLGLVCVVLFFVATQSNQALLICSFVFGGLSFPLYSLCVSHANDLLHEKQMVSASRGLVLAYGLGASFGPKTCSVAMNVFGPQGIYLYNAMICIGIVGFTIYRMAKRPTKPDAKREHFISTLATTPAVFDLDPRCHQDEKKP